MITLPVVSVKYPFQSLQARLVEISQTKAVQFAFVNKQPDGHFHAIHTLVKCRDYLSDVMHFHPLQRDVEIFGFKLQAEQNTLNWDRTRLLIRLPSEPMAAQFRTNFPFIQQQEMAEFKIDPAKLYAVEGSKTKFLLDADPFWMNCTQLISYLTLLCRCSLYLEPGNYKDWWTTVSDSYGVDSEYMGRIVANSLLSKMRNFTKIDYSLSPTPSGWAPNVSVDNVHTYSGIYSLACPSHDTRHKNVICQQFYQCG